MSAYQIQKKDGSFLTFTDGKPLIYDDIDEAQLDLCEGEEIVGVTNIK